jgi:LVIVD repeat
MNMLKKYLRRGLSSAALALGVAGLSAPGHGDPIPPGWAARNMEPVGYSAMGDRLGAFKMAIRKVNGRWYLYTGHLWHYGWSIVDVTNPKDPKLVKFIPGPDNTWTIQMTLHGNLMVTALQKGTTVWGIDSSKPNDEGILIWDISDPVNPVQVSQWKTGGTSTHRNSYPGGKYAYLSAGMPGYNGNILVAVDVSNPAQPKEAGRWWMPGQKDGEPPGRRSQVNAFFYLTERKVLAGGVTD